MPDPAFDFQPEEQQFDFQPAGTQSAPVESAKLPPEVLRAISSVPYHPPRMEFSPVAPIPDMPGEAPYSMKRAIVGGMTDVLTHPSPGAETSIPPLGPEAVRGTEELGTPGQRTRGALRLGATGLEAATPFVGPAIIESPLNVARGFGEGYVAGKGARYVAKKAGAEPETQDLAESVGQLGPLVGESILRPRFGVASTPEATTASAGVRGAGAGVAVTPEAVTVRGKVGPLEGSKTFARKAKPEMEAPTLTPQTIEGELAKNPATRDEISEAQVATNYAGPEQAKAAVVAKRQAQASAVPPGGAEKPAGAEKAPAVTPTKTAEPAPSAPEIIGKPTAKPRTNGEPLEHGFDFRPAEDVGTAVREATQKTNGALPRDERRKVERTPEEQQTQMLFKQARTELGEDASSDQVMTRVEELKRGSLAKRPQAVSGEVLPPSAKLPTRSLPDVKEELRDQYPNNSEEALDRAAREQFDFEQTQRRGAAIQPERKELGEGAQVDFQPDLYKHRSTQVNIPEDSEAHSALDSARQRIADGDLAGDGKDIGGNHVTVRWGLTAPDDDKLEKLKSYISSLSPFEATLGKTEKFKPSESSDGAAVIQAPIEAPELGKINSELAKHAPFTEPTFKSYTPHATIAYVKPEKADRYVGMSVTHGKKFTVNSIAISDRQGNHEEVTLEGKAGAKGEPIPPFHNEQVHGNIWNTIDSKGTAWVANSSKEGADAALKRITKKYGEKTPQAKGDSLKLTHPPADIGVSQYLDSLPAEQQKFARDTLEWYRKGGGDSGELAPSGDDLPEAVADEIDARVSRLAKPLTSGTRIEAANEPENQPARAAGKTEDLSRVSEPARESGSPPAAVPSGGNETPAREGQPAPSARSADGERLEQPARQPGERNEPARSGRSSPAPHPPAQRETGGGGTARPRGADGKPVESPTPESPEEAKSTVAEARNRRNFRISDEFVGKIGAGGEITKIKGNLDALETLKKIQGEGRELATPEEQETLAKYVDFGGLVGMLQRWWEPQYKGHYERYQKLLTSAEQQEIRETLPNTHYTSMQVVDWMWKAMARMGLKGGRILEPGMGIGNFLGRIPEKIASRAELLGVERNPLTGGMAKLLYPDANISVKSFQDFLVPNNTLDAVIGNVPFQDVNITDDPAYAKLKLNLHNYFIVKSLDKLKPGGIGALITSRYTMDSGKGQRAREEMAKRADLVAAIRLPDTAFKRSAGTEVVADLLIFQKRAPDDVIEKMPEWTTLAPVKVGDKEFLLNKYFVDNPNHVLGEHSSEGSMYGPRQYTVKSPQDFASALAGAVDLIPAKIFGKLKSPDLAPPPTLDPGELQFAPEDVKPGAFYRDEKGNLRIKEAGVGVVLPEDLRGVDKQVHIGHAIDLRDQLNRTIQTQLESSDDEPLKEEQKKLGALYESYRKKYGSLHGPKLHKVFSSDPEYPKLLALENLDTENKTVSKAAIFTKRVLAPYEPLRDLPDDPKSAMLKVMAERGYLDTALMASLLKKPEAEVIANLADKGLIFQDPHTGNYHTSDEYLSGNVRDKLRDAEKAASTDQKFAGNVEALKKVQPERLSIHEIQPNLGQTWIPISVYQSFVRHLAQSKGEVEISRDGTGRWLVQVGNINRFHLQNSWSGGGIEGHKLVQAALNQQQPTVWIKNEDGSRSVDAQATTAAREKLAAIKEEFRTVLRRANQSVVDQLEDIYNNTFNSFRLREFSGEHLDFPGMSEEWRGKIRGYQKAGVWRILQEGRAGLFHAPGLGKTLTMASAGMEARRLKLSRKNMYAVPNHMVNQWREDFKRFYPNANVLAVSDEDFNAQNRAKLMSRIATGDWDAVVVPHSQFDLLPMSPDWEAKTINKRLADYREVLEDLDEKEARRTIKQIEKNVDKLESRLNELNAKQKDNTIAFDQMGVDMLFVDEAQAYKAMAVPSRMGNVGGISNRASQRAFALEMKADFLRDTHKGRGLVFGTGTPITNTVGELYVMTKYLAPEMLESAGIRSFDDWAANFATTITQFEYAADGVNFRPKTTLSEFVNVPELSMMFRRYAEYLSKAAAKQLSNLKEPEAQRKDHMLKVTPTQEPLLQLIADRGEHLTKHPPRTTEERKEDNWLKLSSDARKISLDPRLYNPDLPDDPGSKVNTAVEDIKQSLDATAEKKGTVVVFSDFFQHKGPDGKPDFNLFEDLRKKLVKAGVPKEQIAIIHEADSKDEKEELFSKVRAGKVRVIAGSTDKMGIGTNIQDRLKVELHLDQPWRPDQVEQREGRIVRSGNMWDNVEIHRYITEPEEGTVKRWDPEQQKEVEKPRPRAYDLQMYQQLARKAHFQEQFLTGNYKGRTMEDVGGDVKLNSQMFELAKAMATGNPDAMRKIKVEHDLRTYGMLERNFQVQRSKQLRELANSEFRIPIVEQKIALLERDAALWAKAEDNVSLQIGDVKRDGEELKAWLNTEPNIADLAGKTLLVGGLRTELEQSFGKELNKKSGIWEDSIDYRYSLAGEEHKVPFDQEKQVHHVRAFLNSFASRARGLDGYLHSAREDLKHYQENQAALKEELKKPSPYIDKVEAMEKEIREIDQRLGVAKPEADEGAAPDEEEESSLGKRLQGESGAFTPARLHPARLKHTYAEAAEALISGPLKLGDKYYDVTKVDPEVADILHRVDNAPRLFREKAKANLTKTLDGLSEDQIRLASLLVDSDSRDYLEAHKPEEYRQATHDPAVMDAVQKFIPLQQELTRDRQALGWPVRKSLSLEEIPDAANPWMVKDRDGNPVADFRTEGQAKRFIEKHATVEPHLKRTYPEHLRSPLPAETGKAPYTGTFYADKGLRPPKMDKKAREMSAEYHYQHGAKDFSGYLETYARTKEAVLKQELFDQFSAKATEWVAGTAQPPTISYAGQDYTRPDLALQMRRGGKKNVREYSVYDPSRGERFLIKAQDWSTLTTGKPGIGPNDRFLGPKTVVDALEKYDSSRGGDGPGKLRRFFQEQIVGLFGPMVHVNNILRRIGQSTGAGVFDPRSWPSLAKVIASPELRARVLQGVDDSTIELLVARGAYTDWSDIGNLNAYIGGNLNPVNWLRNFGKGVLFDPKFLKGWGGLDPKARVIVADYFQEHYPHMTEQQVADAVNDGFGNYNRANWTERQRQLARFTLFPGWDAASFKWFLRHPFLTAIAPALVVLAINLALQKLGKAKADDAYDFSYLHWGDRKYRSGLFSDALAQHLAQPVLSAAEAALRGEEVGSAAGEGLIRGAGGVAGTLRPEMQLIAEQLFNRKFAGSASEIVKPEDRNLPGTWLPNRDLEKRAIFAALKAFPAIQRFLAPDQSLDVKTGVGSILGVTNYRSGAEERLRANVAKAKGYSETLAALAEHDPAAAEKYARDPTKAVLLVFHGDLSQLSADLKQIDAEKAQVALAPGIANDARKQMLEQLTGARQQVLTSADALDDALTAAKLRMKGATQ